MIDKPSHPCGDSPLVPRRILHLEDNEFDRQLLRETIMEYGIECDYVHAESQPDFEAALEQGRFDLIISDFTLPGYNGMVALATARRKQPETPFLFVSGTIGEERAVESLKSGATDYVLKTHLGRLGPAIERALRDARERALRKQLEEQLRQSQKMEAIGQLAGGVAHDFNNLLAVIRGNVELVLLRDEELSAESRECLHQVTGASERAANLTRQLLAFGRKQTLQSKAVKLNDILSNLTKMLKRVIGANIDLQYNPSPLPIIVEADVSMIEQVLLNLVVNARDAMPKGGALTITTERISIPESYAQLRPEARGGDFACLSVSDSGTGIAPEHLPRLFEPFFTTKEVGKGTGLGLATVYGIVKQHGGWVEVSTRLGFGTTFKVFLPVVGNPAEALPRPSGDASLRGGNERILLAEDDPALRALTRRILETFGYQVLEAASGRDALEVSARDPGRIDLLCTDMIMPDGVMGRELAERLRAQRPQLKVLYVSGYTRDIGGKDTEFIRRTQRSYLQKPYASHDLISTVRRCLDENDPANS